jgi:hypothetical protein
VGRIAEHAYSEILSGSRPRVNLAQAVWPISELLEHVLGEWCGDPSLWPVRRDYKTFREWCEVILHSMVFDMVEAGKSDHGLN